MDLKDILNEDNIKKLAEKVGVDPKDVMSAAKKVLPKITGGIKGLFSDDEPKDDGKPRWNVFAQAANGTWKLGQMPPTDIIEAYDLEQGNKVLEAALGGKDGSRAVAEQAAKETGVDAGAIKKMLPGLASLVMSEVQQKGKASDDVATKQNDDGSIDWSSAIDSDKAKEFLKNLF